MSTQSNDQPPPAPNKVSLTWDELTSPKVEERLSELSTVRSTRSHYERANVPTPIVEISVWSRLMNSAIVFMPVMGIVAGLLGWLCATLLGLTPNLEQRARTMLAAWNDIDRAVSMERFTPEEAERAKVGLRRAAEKNPFFQLMLDGQTRKVSVEDELVALRAKLARSELRSEAMFFGVAGLFLGMLLAAAERIVDRNVLAALTHAAAGAALGLLGAIAAAVVSQFVARLALTGNDWVRDELPRVLSWSVLGLLLGAAAGVVMRSPKRALLGSLGGLIGGAIGAVSVGPILAGGYSIDTARGVAVVLMGLFTGLAMAVLESAAKVGWLIVTQGPVAGKQFILYRNPTFIGSAPMSHIYLFRDPAVGRRHAAIHVVPGGYELEDLPLGTITLVNDRPAPRVILRHGDTIRVGKTVFVFQQKSQDQ